MLVFMFKIVLIKLKVFIFMEIDGFRGISIFLKGVGFEVLEMFL